MQRESESSSSAVRLPSLRKLCVVFNGYKVKSDDYEYNFYIVDRDSSSAGGDDEYPHMKRTIRFKGSKVDSPAVAFCALNSTLYMFEGDGRYRNGEGTFEGRFAGKFELTPEIVVGFDYEVERNDLISIKPMHQRKISPKALPTPDGKSILVFSSKLDWGDECRYDDSFELYNVAQNSWKALPRLPPTLPWLSCHFDIVAYGFESESRFVIQMYKGLVFVLNLQTQKWEDEEEEDFVPIPDPEGYFIGIDGFCFTRLGAYDIRDHGLGPFGFDHPLSAFPDDHYDYDYDYDPSDRRRPCIALLGDECDGAFDIGVVQAERPSEYYRRSKYNNLLVILDICRIDHVQFRRDYEKYRKDNKEDLEEYRLTSRREGEESPPEMCILSTTVSKTLKFLVDYDFGNYYCGEMNVFPI